MSRYSGDGSEPAGQPVPPAEVLVWARQTAHAARAACGGELIAAYLHGSAALGGWSAGSDVDLLLVAADQISGAAVAAAGRVLAASGRGCPGRGLESSIVAAAAAAGPTPPWPFLLHVVTGSDEPDGIRMVAGRDRTGDPDLLMHYVVCRAAGLAVLGPPAPGVIGPVSRPAILRYLASELRWGLEHGAEAYAVLNACRALVYLSDGTIVSKLTGGAAGLRRGLGPAGVIRRSLAEQQGRGPARRPGDDTAEFVRSAAAALEAAARPAEGQDEAGRLNAD